jgi:oligogalacturonide transport system substrate-binding protein
MKKSVKAMLSMMIACLLMVSTLAACGGSSAEQPATTQEQTSQDQAVQQTTAQTSDEPVTLRFSWWGGDTRHQATLDAIKAYMEQNKNVTIEGEYSGFSGYYQKLVTQLASGTAPDVFQSDQGWTTEFYKRGNVFADLGQYSGIIKTDKLNTAMLNDYCVIDGKTVVLPLGYNGTVFLYNKDLMAPYLKDGKLELTWDEFIQIGKEMHQKDSNVYLTTNMTDAYIRFLLKPILEQITNKISVQDDYTLGFTKEDMTKTFEKILEVFDSGAAQPYAESVIYKDSLIDNPKWAGGQIGGAFIFFSNIDKETHGLTQNFDVTSLPRFADAQTSGQESAPSLMIAINSESGSKDAAAKFVNWFLNDTGAAAVLKTERGVPTNSDALEVLKSNGTLSAIMAKAIDVSNATIGFKNGAIEMNASVHAIFVEKTEKVIYKKETPDQAAEELIKDLTAKLAEMKGQ